MSLFSFRLFWNEKRKAATIPPYYSVIIGKRRDGIYTNIKSVLKTWTKPFLDPLGKEIQPPIHANTGEYNVLNGCMKLGKTEYLQLEDHGPRGKKIPNAWTSVFDIKTH